jgi:hypothetical protein
MINHQRFERLGLEGVGTPMRGVDEPDIIAFELWLKKRLPEDYKEFLRRYGHGRTSTDTTIYFQPLEEFNSDGWGAFELLYGLKEGGYSALPKLADLLHGNLPDEFLAIGRDAFGNQICLGLEGEDYGKIYFFDHETGGLYLIAPSFAEFVEGFHDRQEYLAMRRGGERG